MHWHQLDKTQSEAIAGVGFTKGPRLVVEFRRRGTWEYPTVRTPLCCDIAKLHGSKGAWLNSKILDHHEGRRIA